MGDTVLQPTDRQHIAEPHLLLVTTFSQFMLIINHLQLKVDAGFFHLQYISIEYHPIATEGGRYGNNYSIYFCIPDSKTQNIPNFTMSPIPDHH